MKFKRLKVVYFSPTRTSKKILKNIAKSLDIDEIEEFDLTYPHEQEIQASSDELLLLGAPVYAGRLPVEVVNRFQKIKANNTFAIVVVVYGNREFEDALLELKNLALELGCKPIAGGAFVGEHSFSTDELPIAKDRPDISDIQSSQEFALKVKEKIKSISADTQEDLKVPGNFPYKDAMPKNSVAPVVKEELCGLCGACIEVCPTEAIFLDENIQTNPSLCIRCCACIKNCPSEARVIEDSAWKAIAVRLNANCSERKEPEFFL